MRGQRGQASVEWVGLIALTALLLAALVAATGTLSVGTAVPRALLERFVCAVRLSEDCRAEPSLRAAEGPELAALLRAHAPALLYEDGMRALPVDFRRCRADACAEGPGGGHAVRSNERLPVTAFTHVVDCRRPARRATVDGGADCSGPRAGNLYLQFWFYYPGSATAEGSTPLRGVIRELSSAVGRPSHHPDDWESWQVRIGPDGRRASRASSHHGYGGGWVPDRDRIWVSGGSHAGRAGELRAGRTTKDHRLVLAPLEPIARRDAWSFAVVPPWRKRVWRDPEYGGTD
ncbi:MAG: hypothetical protein FJW90_04775 [Actinobacteria bacterium]|nr:hypothetical protein [Actinomycetota bacterium]